MKCEYCPYFWYNEEYEREMCNFEHNTPWDKAPCEEDGHYEDEDYE